MNSLSTIELSDANWHTLSVDEALESLNASPQGLTEDEVTERQAEFGKNEIPLKGGPGIFIVIIRQFRNPLIYVLLAAAVVSAAIGEIVDASFIFGVLAINALVGSFQEWQAETGARALRGVVRVRSIVLRRNALQDIDAAELVPGDIVQLESGNTVPADLRILSAIEATADESILTGESVPVRKHKSVIDERESPVGDRLNMMHAGTSVVSGRATAVVCVTGLETQLGQIASSLTSESGSPPLVARMERFTTMLAIALVGIIVVLGAIQLVRGAGIDDVFFLAIALAVSAIPEGLPVGVTVALSIASRRMAGRGVIVRVLHAVEGLGACTVIATDKTGTLTVNSMTVKRIGLPEGSYVDVEGEGLVVTGRVLRDGVPASEDVLAQVRDIAVATTLCNEGALRISESEVVPVGDTVDTAFLVLGEKLGVNKVRLEDENHPVGAVPFESERRYAACYNTMNGATSVSVKGAVETVLEMCPDADRVAIDRQANEMASQGFRVIAIASGEVDSHDPSVTHSDEPSALRFLGLAGLIDPVRPDVPEAIAKCHRAGVDVKMVTGDHPVTALAIARQIGIAQDESEVVHGREMAELEGDAGLVYERIRNAHVFARVEPAQKMRIITALQECGNFVAVTGDGVNDAPALRAANIGISMGRGGTDVARDASDLILTDDNFSSIIDGIEEGRAAYDNVRKIVWLLLATAVGELVLFLLSTLTGVPVPLTAVQLLWLNVVTEGIQGVALGFEKREPGLLNRKPRPPSQQIFDRRMIEQVVIGGAIMGVMSFGLFYVLYERWSWSEFESRNLVLLLMVLFENVHVFNSRSEVRSVLQVPFSANPLVVIGAIAAQGLHIFAMYTPGLRDVLELEPVSIATWVSILSLSLTLLVATEIYKLARKRWPHNVAGTALSTNKEPT